MAGFKQMSVAGPDGAGSAIMRVGVAPCLDPKSEGIFQYSLCVLQALREYCVRRSTVRITVLASVEEIREYSPAYPDFSWLPIEPESSIAPVAAVLRRGIGEGPHRDAWRFLKNRFAHSLFRIRGARGGRLADWYRSHGIRFLYCTHSFWPAFEVGIPYVFTVHDLQHRLQPEFSENTEGGWWNRAESLHRHGSVCASLVIVESETGRLDLLQEYGDKIAADRIRVLPYCPPPHARTLAASDDMDATKRLYNLPDRYFFYPAAFWSHKNHFRIVEALARLRDLHGLEISVVFCGSRPDKHSRRQFERVMHRAEELRVTSLVKYLGHVPDEMMEGLYANAVALVMPTFFGPTNLPVLEAWATGCPVLSSRIRGVEEQVGSAGLLVDPVSVAKIAEGMRRLWTDQALRAELIARGLEKTEQHTPRHFQRCLSTILDEAIELLGADRVARFG
jgi:glycosyltransferase involved in cell wall biosynthesis